MNEATFNNIVAQCIANGSTHMQATAVALAMKHACTDPAFAQQYGAFTQDALIAMFNKA